VRICDNPSMEATNSDTPQSTGRSAAGRTVAGLFALALTACASSAVNPGETHEFSPVPVAGVYRGTLGTTPIELVLTLDTSAEDSVDGWYVPLGAAPSTANRVLVAGEFEKDALSMEESHNGVDVSGTWSATLSKGGINGTWTDAEGEHEMPVMLKRIVGAAIPNKP
jgi:hypothetical protein